MNTMKRLTIENFQSHQKTVIDFAPAGGLTVIVGPSDTGKTVIIRALRWLFYNQPQGLDFVRTGASMVRVRVIYESGHTVVRERTVSTNRYKIIAPGAGETGEAKGPAVFEGFGNNVPLEVQEITGVRSVRIGDDNYTLNLSEQLDGPFLGTKQISSPARAKVLGKMAGTEEIDVAGQELGTDLYRRGQDSKRLEAEIAGLVEDIKRYDYLPALKTKIEELDWLLSAIKSAQDRKTKLENLRFSLATVANNIVQCNRIVERWQGVAEAEKVVALQEQSIQRKNIIQSHRQNLFVAEQGIVDTKAILGRLTYLPEAGDMVNVVEVALPRLQRVKELKMSLVKVNTLQSGAEIVLNRWAKIGEIESAQNNVMDLVGKRLNLTTLKRQLQTVDENEVTAQQNSVVWEQRVAELEGAYRDALLVAGVCPTCGTEMTAEALKRAV